MEPLFINKIMQSKKNLVEMNKAFSGVKFTMFRIIVSAFMLLFSAFWYFELQSLTGCIIVALIGIAYFFIPLIQLHYNTSKHEKRYILLYNRVPQGTTYFYDNNIFSDCEVTKGELNVSYDKIIKIKQSKNLYLLILKEKLVIMVDKKRFEKGNCEDFEKFIKEKAVNAKIKL